jgi:uroporphyrinogen-III synthase
LTSPNIARGLLKCLDDTCRARIQSGEIKLVSISPVTSAVILEAGLKVAVEANEYTTDGMIDVLIESVTCES